MTNPTKEQVEKLIDKLAVTQRVFYEPEKHNPAVLIGDVLEKALCCKITVAERIKRRDGIINKWMLCGFTRSLQGIVEKSGWEEIPAREEEVDNGSGDKDFHKQFRSGYRLKNENANQLATFLIEIFNV